MRVISTTMLILAGWVVSMLSPTVHALSTRSSQSSSPSSMATVPLTSVDSARTAVLDGAEWASIQAELMSRRTSSRKRKDKRSKYGYMKVVVGKDESGQRLIGMKCLNDDNNNDETQIFVESMAKLPSGVSTADALSTYITGLSTVHAVLPKAEAIGGSQDSKDSMVGGKAVVLGGNDLACFAAQGLASLGVNVSLVSCKNPKVPKPSKGSVGTIDILKPAVGDAQIGFAQHIGSFNSLLDTIGNERPLNTSPVTLFENAIDGEEEDELPFYSLDDPFASPTLGAPGSVLDLLRSRHECETYISTVTHSQTLIETEGVFAGPRQTEEYAQTVEQKSFYTQSRDCEVMPPPTGLGKTMEQLMGQGVIFPASTKNKMHQKSETVRGWTLADFWEGTTWPQDTAGTAQVRFGMPVLDDADLDNMFTKRVEKEDAKIAASRREAFMDSGPPTPIQDNPFVHQISGVPGVESEIIEKKLDSVLFLSAKFCRTCKTINPQYTRIARIGKEERQSPTVFCKAEASGLWGKDLGKYLKVDAVPVFILFRNGERFGSPISVSKLPSPKLQRALDLLESGDEWDKSVLRDDIQ